MQDIFGGVDLRGNTPLRSKEEKKEKKGKNNFLLLARIEPTSSPT